jgi:hypothetical protein
MALATLFGGQETDIDRIIASSSAARFSIAFLAVATAPIVEETIYRGVLFAPLQRSAGTKAAICIVSVMFAAVHLMQYRNNSGVIAAVTVLSLVLTWVRAQHRPPAPLLRHPCRLQRHQAIIIVAQPYLKTLLPAQPSAPQGMLLDALARASRGSGYKTMTHEVIVVGAGVGGLTTAALLAARGVDVCVLEKEPAGGGCATTFERFGYDFETTAGLYAGWGAARHPRARLLGVARRPAAATGSRPPTSCDCPMRRSASRSGSESDNSVGEFERS